MENGCVTSLRYDDYVSRLKSVAQFHVVVGAGHAGLLLSIDGARLNRAVDPSRGEDIDDLAGDAWWAIVESQVAWGTRGMGLGTCQKN